MTEISVVIPAYGHCPHLLDLLHALLNGDVRPGKIIVSHSGPGDPARGIAAISDLITVLHQPGRLFPGAARNYGAAVARGEWLAFIDADVRPRPGWLRELSCDVRKRPRRFVVGSVGYAISGGYWGMCNWLCEFSSQAPWHPARAQTGGASCNMILSARDFRDVGGFPEDQRGSEDTMLFSRLIAMGWEQWFAPAARVDHYNQTGLATFARHQYMLGFHSALVRRRMSLRGSLAARFWPLALVLWIPRLALLAERLIRGGPAWWLRGLAFSPGLVLGSWSWTAGYLKRAARYEPAD